LRHFQPLALREKLDKVSDFEVPTIKPARVPITLIVGGNDRLIGAVSEAAISAQLLVAECDVADAASTAAEMRPLVIVLSTEVYEADVEGYDNLAEDVRARLLVVAGDVLNPTDLEEHLIQLMNAAESARPSWSGDLG
jgi:hypothetical protein